MGILGGDLDQAKELFSRVIDLVAFKVEPREVGARRDEAGIDAQCFPVVLGGASPLFSAFRQQSESMMGLGDVPVDVHRFIEFFLSQVEVAALHLHEREVHERVDEPGVILERQGEPRFGEGQISACECIDARGVEGDGLGGEEPGRRNLKTPGLRGIRRSTTASSYESYAVIGQPTDWLRKIDPFPVD